MQSVSVIIPTFRRPEYICDAIESVLNQTIHEIEIIVVDDNGKGTLHQIENEKRLAYYIENNKIKYIAHERNKNGAAARNTGIVESKAKYIAFLDDDDTYKPKKIEEQIKKMNEEQTKACLCGFTRQFKNKAIYSCPKETDVIIENVFLQKVDTCAGSGLVIEKELISELNGFDESFERQQDLELLVRILQKTKISVCEGDLLNIRMHSQNLRVPNLEKTVKQRMHFLETFENLIKSYPSNVIKKIYDTQYTEIAKIAIKNKNASAAIKWICKTSNPPKTMLLLIRDTVVYLKSKRNK